MLQRPCFNPSPACCPPSVGPTGATGATGPAPMWLGPQVVLTAAFNAPSISLTQNVTTIIPFSLALTGNPLGLASLVTSQGSVTIPLNGIYRIDFNVSFQVAIAAVAGTGLTLVLRKNSDQQLTTASYQFDIATAANGITNSLSSFWIGSFVQGDSISLAALSNLSVATSILGPVATGVAPFNTLLSITSVF